MNNPYNVLFLCTGNSARSIMAESLLRHWGRDQFVAFSAGSHPSGKVHPLVLDLLQQMKLPDSDLRSKSWQEFAMPTAPRIDFVITVCDQAAGEMCPVWPGQPITAHWGVADPVPVQGTPRDKTYAFRRALLELENRIKALVNLPLRSLDNTKIKQHLHDIGDIQLIPPLGKF